MKSCHISQSTGPDLNLRPPDYEGLLPTSPQQYHTPHTHTHTRNQTEATKTVLPEFQPFQQMCFGKVRYSVHWVINGKFHISFEHLSNVRVVNYLGRLKVS
jgi:hypothetical protein